MNRAGTDRPLLRTFAGWRVGDAGSDAAAALALAAIAIPEQMATARLGGFPPAVGFWVFIAGSLGFALLGASRVLSAGADSTITPIFAGSLAAFGAFGSPHYFALAALLALLVGAMVMASGLFRLGAIANLLSVPVTTGFLAGIGVHIAASQLPALLGLSLPHANMWTTVSGVLAGLGGTNPYAVAIGAGVFAVTALAERIDKRIPGAIVGVATAALCVVAFGLDKRGVAVLGAVGGGLPLPGTPDVGAQDIARLFPLAILISLVVMIQTAATHRSFTRSGGAPDIDRDFIGIGAGSLVSGFLGGFAVNASPPRTAVVMETGGRSGLSSILAALIVGAIALFGSSALSHVPQAALAGLLFFVAFRIVRVQAMMATFEQTKPEFLLILATAGAIIALPIATGVGVGVLLSLLHGLWTITRAQAIEFGRVPGTTIWWPVLAGAPREKEPGVAVIGFQAPLFFLNAEQFRRSLSAAAAAGAPRLVVLEASNIVEIDFSAAQVLSALIAELKAKGVAFAIARLESIRAHKALERFGIVGTLGADRIFLSVEEAVRAWRKEGGGRATPEARSPAV